MKRQGHLFDKLIDFDNLMQAAYAVLRGKRGQAQACGFVQNIEKNIFEIQRELKNQSWQPGGYRAFWIKEPKPRLISAATIRDRVVHHALIQVIEPVFERQFIHHSYACRKGRGTHKARAHFYEQAKKNSFVLKMDIRKFFPSIDHEVLKATIEQSIKDKEVLALCATIIDNANAQENVVDFFPGDSLLTPAERRKGIPIGNLTSQFFANVYLNQLDHYTTSKLGCHGYLRYVDDFCCFGNTKAELQQKRSDIVEKLSSLRLKLNDRKSRIRQLKEGIEFLGFCYFPDRIRLSSRNVRSQRRKLKKLQAGYASGDYAWADVRASLEAWNNHACGADSWRLRVRAFRSARFQRDRLLNR